MLHKWPRLLRRHDLWLQWGASTICAMVSLGLSVLIARLMGPTLFGNYALWLGIGAVMGIFLDAGFRTLLLRERTAPTGGSQLQLEKDAPSMLGHLLLIGLPLGAIAGGVSGNWSGPGVVLCFAAITLAQWYSAWLKGAGEFRLEAKWQLAGRLISASLIVAALLLFDPTPAIVFVAWAVGLLLAIQVMGPRVSIPAALPVLMLYRGSLSFAAVDLATLIYNRADIILLYSYSDAAEVGRYAAAYRLYDGILLLAAPLTLLLFRHMRLSPDLRPEVRAMGLALGAGIMLSTAGWLLGNPVTAYLFGPEFTQGHLISWLLCALIFALPNGVLTQWAIARHQERYYALAAAAAASCNIALNVALIPQHGALGAAWATIATEALLGTLLLARCWCCETDRVRTP